MTVLDYLVSLVGPIPSGMEFIYYIAALAIVILSVGLFIRFLFGAVSGLFFR